MVTGTLRREGDKYVVDLAPEDVERGGFHDGQQVGVTLPEGGNAQDETHGATADDQQWRALARQALAHGWTEADRAYEQLLQG